jgi:hypothetical protein
MYCRGGLPGNPKSQAPTTKEIPSANVFLWNLILVPGAF